MKKLEKINTTIICVMFILAIGATLAIGQSQETQWPIREPLPGGVYLAQSPKWHSPINSRILRAKELSDSLFGHIHLPNYELYVAEEKTQFDELVKGDFPEWGAAVAIPQLSRIVLKSPNLKRSSRSPATHAAHEFAHLQTHALSGGAAPRWLDEGLARYFAEEWSYEDFISVSLTAVRGNLIPLADLVDLNSFSETQAQIAYAESYLAVSYFFDYYGPESMRDILAELKAGKNIDAALQSIIGLDEKAFESEAFAEITTNHTLLGILMASSIFWIALALVVVIGFFKAMASRKARYAKWEEEERLQSTDFDYGDPDNPEKIEDEDKPWEQE